MLGRMLIIMLTVGMLGCAGQIAQPIDNAKAGLINVKLGLGYLEQGQVTRAREKLNHALELAPNLSEAHSAMAYLLESADELAAAEKEYKKAISLTREAGAFYNNYGAYLCRQKRFAEADRAFKLAVKDRKYLRVAEVYESAGICALQAGEEAKAKKYFQTAIKRDPRRAASIKKYQ